jgi:hypothetical protein
MYNKDSTTVWDGKVPRKVIVLEKITDLHGDMPVGSTHEWDYKTTFDFEARARARKSLERDHPKENATVDWVLQS